jgi:hypothetical protein
MPFVVILFIQMARPCLCAIKSPLRGRHRLLPHLADRSSHPRLGLFSHSQLELLYLKLINWLIDIEMYSFTWNARTYRHDEIWAAANEYSVHIQSPFLKDIRWILDTPNPSAIADEVAEAFKTVYGDIILWDGVATIMDDLADATHVQTDQGRVLSWYLIRALFKPAFAKAGFRYGRECSEEEIKRVQMRQKWSIRFIRHCTRQRPIGPFQVAYSVYTFDHAWMRKTHDQRQLREELVQYIHQPRFIQKWIEAGNNAEDYLE